MSRGIGRFGVVVLVLICGQLVVPMGLCADGNNSGAGAGISPPVTPNPPEAPEPSNPAGSANADTTSPTEPQKIAILIDPLG